MTDLCRVVPFDDDWDVYIGRAGKGWSGYFGNPFRRKPSERRGATLERFKAYLFDRLARDLEFNARVMGLAGKRLGCPGRCPTGFCHGGIIAGYVNEAMKEAEWLNCVGCEESWMGVARHHSCPLCGRGPFCNKGCGSLRNHEPCASKFYP